MVSNAMRPTKTKLKQQAHPILVPSNLGLKPLLRGHQPGAWRAPHVLIDAGILAGVDVLPTTELDRPAYDFGRQTGTSIRNGNTLRDYSLTLADIVTQSLTIGALPIVIGGDCSVLLGCLVGARSNGSCGLVHVDGHSDFYYPGIYDPESTLGTAAGMDLALATGRGEPLLAQWPDVSGPLVTDQTVIQIGDRDAGSEDDYLPSTIRRIDINEALNLGVTEVVSQVFEHFRHQGISRIWVHVDLDVLDEAVMPAVDSPGSPGFDFSFLSSLIEGLMEKQEAIGLNLTIYDPEEDPAREYATLIAQSISSALTNAQKTRNE